MGNNRISRIEDDTLKVTTEPSVEDVDKVGVSPDEAATFLREKEIKAEEEKYNYLKYPNSFVRNKLDEVKEKYIKELGIEGTFGVYQDIESGLKELMTLFENEEIIDGFYKELNDENLDDYIKYVESHILFQEKVKYLEQLKEEKEKIREIKESIQTTSENGKNSDTENKETEKDIELTETEKNLLEELENSKNIYELLYIPKTYFKALGLSIKGKKGARSLDSAKTEDDFFKFYYNFRKLFIIDKKDKEESEKFHILEKLEKLKEKYPNVYALLQKAFKGNLGLFFIFKNKTKKNSILNNEYEKMTFFSRFANGIKLKEFKDKILLEQKNILRNISSLERKLGKDLLKGKM